MGQSPPGSTYNTQQIGLPFFQGKAEFGEVSPSPLKWCSQPNRIAQAGDILLSVRAPVGPTNYASTQCCIGRGLAAIRGDEQQVDQNYLGYFLKRFESYLSRRGVGSTFSAINRRDIEAMELPVPPLSEQERIVKVLDEADAIRKLRAQADQRTADLIPALFQQQYAHHNTVSWADHSFGDEEVLRIIDGDRGVNYPKKMDFMGAGHCLFLNTSNVRHGAFDLSKCDFVSQSKDESLRKGKLSRGDVVLTTRGTLGNSAHYNESVHYEDVRINSGMVILRPTLKKLLPEFLLLILNSREFQEQVTSLTSGSAQQQLPINKLTKIKFSLPTMESQMELTAHAEGVRMLSGRQESTRRALDSLLESTMLRAFAV
jgi:type I restriction enzyme S subunit